MRIAIVGGADYLPEVFEDFLYALHRKYPDAVIVCGTAAGKNLYEEDGDGKKKKVGSIPSAEGMAYSLMTGLGHTVEQPDMTTKTAQYLGGDSDLQLGWICSGQWELFARTNEAGKKFLDHRWITPRPDVIVAVGNLESSRAKYAYDAWKKFDAWRLEENRRPFHNVAAPVKEKKHAARRPKKKIEQTEQIAA